MVGVLDPIAGEVPVGIVRDLSTTSASDLRDAVLQQMGAAFVPDGIITLPELGLGDFPKTTSGKVQKSKLTNLVRTLWEQRVSLKEQSVAKNSVRDIVLRIWYKSTGIPVEHLDMQVPISNFADSINIMRVRDALRKELGFTMSLDEMVEHQNLEAQIKFLQTSTFSQSSSQRRVMETIGPPSKDELAITFGSRDEATEMTQVISNVLSSAGFSWETDADSVLPTTDYWQLMHRIGLAHECTFATTLMVDKASPQVTVP